MTRSQGIVTDESHDSDNVEFVNITENKVNIACDALEKTVILDYDHDKDSDPNNFCTQCKENFYMRKSKCIQCDKCSKWYHIKCVNVTIYFYKHLMLRID